MSSGRIPKVIMEKITYRIYLNIFNFTGKMAISTHSPSTSSGSYESSYSLISIFHYNYIKFFLLASVRSSQNYLISYERTFTFIQDI